MQDANRGRKSANDEQHPHLLLNSGDEMLDPCASGGEEYSDPDGDAEDCVHVCGSLCCVAPPERGGGVVLVERPEVLADAGGAKSGVALLVAKAVFDGSVNSLPKAGVGFFHFVEVHFAALEFCVGRFALCTDLDESLDAHILDRKSTRLNSSHVRISYAVFCLKKKKK